MSDWLTYSPISGHGNGIITITASTLSELEDRVATIIVSNSQYSLSASTSVTQKGAQLTAITFENLTWVTDVPATGGTATKDNCSYTVIGQYTNGTTDDLTDYATVSGSLNVPVSTEMTRQNVGNLTLTATYDVFSATTSVTAYQAAPSVTGINFTSLEWAIDVPASGGTATKDNCTYTIYAYYETSLSKDITDFAVITGSLEVSASRIKTLHSAGTLTLTATYSGFTTTGNVTAYQEAFDPSKEYLTFNILSAGTIKWTTSRFSAARTIDYKLNNGEWTSITSTTEGVVINVNTGDKIQFRGNNGAYSEGFSEFNSFGGSALFEAEGNIMSLTEGDYFKNKLSIGSIYTFVALFRGCANLVSAENLILPATRVGESCYSNMFDGCTSLTTAPELPATTLDARCYQFMFAGCTSLTTAPALPATTLKTFCYNQMFRDCTSLTAAPELPATKLTETCYWGMFRGCTSLNYIKCLATIISARNCTIDWVSGVSSTGTFVKSPNMTEWTTGVDGIPEGWTVTNAS